MNIMTSLLNFTRFASMLSSPVLTNDLNTERRSFKREAISIRIKLVPNENFDNPIKYAKIAQTRMASIEN